MRSLEFLVGCALVVAGCSDDAPRWPDSGVEDARDTGESADTGQRPDAVGPAFNCPDPAALAASATISQGITVYALTVPDVAPFDCEQSSLAPLGFFELPTYPPTVADIESGYESSRVAYGAGRGPRGIRVGLGAYAVFAPLSNNRVAVAAFELVPDTVISAGWWFSIDPRWQIATSTGPHPFLEFGLDR